MITERHWKSMWKQMLNIVTWKLRRKSTIWVDRPHNFRLHSSVTLWRNHSATCWRYLKIVRPSYSETTRLPLEYHRNFGKPTRHRTKSLFTAETKKMFRENVEDLTLATENQTSDDTDSQLSVLESKCKKPCIKSRSCHASYYRDVASYPGSTESVPSKARKAT